MNEINAIIIDDESNSRAVLNTLLQKKCEGINVIATASGAEEGIELLQHTTPDVLFLDIQMPDGSGFDLLRKLKSVDFEVIFVTSYHEYAINAIKFNALDYLLKPVDIEELRETIARLRDRLEKKTQSNENLNSFLDHIDPSAREKKIPVHHNNHVALIPASKIVYISGEGNYSKIITSDQSEYIVGKTLKEIELYFAQSDNLIRARKEIIINVEYLVSYTKTEPCILEMPGKTLVEVSRRKRQEVLDFLRSLNK